MSGPREQFEHEVDVLERRYAEGEMSNAEFNEEMREMERDYRGWAEEQAQQAYDDELERW